MAASGKRRQFINSTVIAASPENLSVPALIPGHRTVVVLAVMTIIWATLKNMIDWLIDWLLYTETCEDGVSGDVVGSRCAGQSDVVASGPQQIQQWPSLSGGAAYVVPSRNDLVQRVRLQATSRGWAPAASHRPTTCNQRRLPCRFCLASRKCPLYQWAPP